MPHSTRRKSMSTSKRKSLRRRLTIRYGNLCHYCEEEMTLPGPDGPSTMCTLEHIVPVAYGGSDDIDNMVLACAGCNEGRGSDLDFCGCPVCIKAIDRYFNKSFKSLMNANKARINKHRGQWRLRLHGKTYSFREWNDAMLFAQHYDSRMSESEMRIKWISKN